MKYNERFIWLDLVRGLCALVVCAGHLRAAVLCNYDELALPTFKHKLFYGITGLGHQAVMVFFVLSGMFVGGSVLKSGVRFNLLWYGVTRLTRLWIVLLPALGVTYLVDSLTLRYSPEVADGAYYPLWNSGPSPGETYSTTLLTFLGNVGFAQTILVPVFGTNSPLWSLANEFWYYILFPLSATAAGFVGSPRNWVFRLAAGAVLLVLTLCLPQGILMGYFVWLMGVAVYSISNRIIIKRRPWMLLVVLSLFGITLLYAKSIRYQALLAVPSDLAVGVGFSSLCIVMAKWPRPKLPIVGNLIEKLAVASSEFSYSLYATHFPFVVLIASLGYAPVKMAPDRNALSQYLGWLCLLLLIGMLFWYVFERNTSSVRRALIRRLTAPYQDTPNRSQ